MVICDFVQSSLNFKYIKNFKKLLFQHNVESMIIHRHIKTSRHIIMKLFWWLQYVKMYHYEKSMCRTFDGVVAVSELDREYIQTQYGAPRALSIPTGVDTDDLTPWDGEPEANRLIFVGSMDWLPNEDAILYFAQHILPRIRQVIPEVTLSVVGRNPSPHLRQKLAHEPAIDLIGWVDDVRPFIARHAVYIVPLRIGGGTRIKIYEAMAMGKAIVSTPIGAEGLPVEHGRHIWGWRMKPSRLQRQSYICCRIAPLANRWKRPPASLWSAIVAGTGQQRCLPISAGRWPKGEDDDHVGMGRSMATVIFWVALALIVYVYFGYPLVLLLAARFRRPTRVDDAYQPTVSLIIAAYNEEKVIREKLENALALDYPAAKLEIVVASDGSSDATDVIVQSYADRGVVLQRVEPRGGKTRALNRVIPQTHGDILVLSDANTMYQPDAIQKLVRHFADPSVGAVSGDVRLVEAAATHAHSEGLYYRYEHGLQRLESEIGSMIGVDGAMYAVARHCYRPPADHTVVDDLVISMTAARLGYRVLFEPEAVAIEDGTSSSQEEFQRKIRVVAGGIQAFLQGYGVPRWRQPLLLFCYVSHKLLRWALPFFLLLLLITSWSLSGSWFYQLVWWAQVLFYGGAVCYALNVLAFRKLRWGNISYYFCLVNGAALVGCCKGIFGLQAVTWKRTQRS